MRKFVALVTAAALTTGAFVSPAQAETIRYYNTGIAKICTIEDRTEEEHAALLKKYEDAYAEFDRLHKLEQITTGDELYSVQAKLIDAAERANTATAEFTGCDTGYGPEFFAQARAELKKHYRKTKDAEESEKFAESSEITTSVATIVGTLGALGILWWFMSTTPPERWFRSPLFP